MPAAVVYHFNLSTWDAKAGGYLQVRDQPGLHSEIQNSQSYMVISCLGPLLPKSECLNSDQFHSVLGADSNCFNIVKKKKQKTIAHD